MAIKTIAVLVNGSLGRETRIAYAVNLAARDDAYLIGIFRLSPDFQSHPASSYVRGHAAIADLLHRQDARNQTLIEQARAALEKRAVQQGVRFEFRIHLAHGHGELRLDALHADLVVAAIPKELWPEDGPAPDIIQLATGVPFLLVPDTLDNLEPPQNILIGWNASRESRRAIGDALPLLALATTVTVLIVDPQTNPLQGEEPGVEVAMFLVRHGVRLTVDPVQSGGKTVAEVIMDHAVSNGHDLIVLGAYSHARSMEIVLGGVTRSLLAHSPIPLLISH